MYKNIGNEENAAKLVSQQQKHAATADTSQLSSLPLSSLAIDASSPLVVQQGLYTPLSTSTPNCVPAINQQSVQSTEDEPHNHQIMPGIAQTSLYPTLSVLSSGASRHSNTEEPFYNQVIKDIDKQLAESEFQINSEENYVEGMVRSTNTSPILEEGNQLDCPPEDTMMQTQPETSESEEPQETTLESPKQDTSNLQPEKSDEKGQILEEGELKENQDQRESQDGEATQDEDTMSYHSQDLQDEHYCTATDASGNHNTVNMEHPVKEPFISTRVRIPNEKVGCHFVTMKLQNYLDRYPLKCFKMSNKMLNK